MATEETFASNSMKGKSKDEPKRVKSKKTTNDNFFNRLAVSDTFASATMKGKIEPSPNDENSPVPKSRTSKTSYGFFNRLANSETASSRRRKARYGNQGDSKVNWDGNSSTSSNSRPSTANTSASKTSQRSRLSVPTLSKPAKTLSRKTLFRRKKSSLPVETITPRPKRSFLSKKNTPKPTPKPTVSISKSTGSIRDTDSVRSVGSIKSSRTAKSTKSNLSRTSRTSATSKTSQTSATTAGSRTNYRSTRPAAEPSSQNSVASRSSHGSRRSVPKEPVKPFVRAPSLVFPEDDDMSFGSDESDEDDVLSSKRPEDKEEEGAVENGTAEPEVPYRALEEEEEEQPMSMDEPLPEPTPAPARPAPQAQQADDTPQVKPLAAVESNESSDVNDSMMSFDDDSTLEKDDDDLNELLGARETSLLGPRDDSTQGDEEDVEAGISGDEFSCSEGSGVAEEPRSEEGVVEEDPVGMETEEEEEDPVEDAPAQSTRYRLFCSDKYHPEKGMQELDASDLGLVDSLLSFETDSLSNEQLSVLIIEAFFRRDFKDGDHWEIDPGTARELEEDEGDGRDLDGRAFVVKQQARWDSADNYSVAAAKGTVTIWPEEEEVRLENYSYFAAG